jgi:hypothetical protein
VQISTRRPNWLATSGRNLVVPDPKEIRPAVEKLHQAGPRVSGI